MTDSQNFRYFLPSLNVIYFSSWWCSFVLLFGNRQADTIIVGRPSRSTPQMLITPSLSSSENSSGTSEGPTSSKSASRFLS